MHKFFYCFVFLVNIYCFAQSDSTYSCDTWQNKCETQNLQTLTDSESKLGLFVDNILDIVELKRAFYIKTCQSNCAIYSAIIENDPVPSLIINQESVASINNFILDEYYTDEELKMIAQIAHQITHITGFHHFDNYESIETIETQADVFVGKLFYKLNIKEDRLESVCKKICTSNSHTDCSTYYVNILKGYQSDEATQNIQSFEESVIQKNIPKDFVLVEGGTLLLGCDLERDQIEYKNIGATLIELEDFYISKYEVTNQEFCDFLNQRHNSKYMPSRDLIPATLRDWIDISYTNIIFSDDEYNPREGYENHAATSVTWFGALAYAEWAGMRLPTYWEWEYAARGGQKSKQYLFSGGDDLFKVAWVRDNALSECQEVGQLQANELGLYDMTGNVYEYCTLDPALKEKLKHTYHRIEKTAFIRGGSFTEGDLISNFFNCAIASINPYHIGPMLHDESKRVSQSTGFRLAFDKNIRR